MLSATALEFRDWISLLLTTECWRLSPLYLQWLWRLEKHSISKFICFKLLGYCNIFTFTLAFFFVHISWLFLCGGYLIDHVYISLAFESIKSCNLIGSESGRYFTILPANPGGIVGTRIHKFVWLVVNEQKNRSSSRLSPFSFLCL